MDLKNISNLELTSRLETLVRSERKLTHVILIHILEIESRRLYAELGFGGMFSYLTKGLGYSESAAYRRLKSARLLQTVPAVAEKLESGALNLSQLTQVQNCVKVANGKTHRYATSTAGKSIELILSKIENKNTFETKKILALEFDQPIQTRTIVSPQKDNSVRIELTFTKEQFEALEKAQNLLSHSIHNNSLTDVIECLAVKFNKSVLGQHQIESQNTEEDRKAFEKIIHRSKSATKRTYLSIKTKRLLMKDAGCACQYINRSTGKRCSSKYQLQIDHVFPLAKGVSNETENLQILCRTHNRIKGMAVDGPWQKLPFI